MAIVTDSATADILADSVLASIFLSIGVGFALAGMLFTSYSIASRLTRPPIARGMALRVAVTAPLAVLIGLVFIVVGALASH
jgi:uncharacterized ion transporter superfamily protein YfcC